MMKLKIMKIQITEKKKNKKPKYISREVCACVHYKKKISSTSCQVLHHIVLRHQIVVAVLRQTLDLAVDCHQTNYLQTVVVEQPYSAMVGRQVQDQSASILFQSYSLRHYSFAHSFHPVPSFGHPQSSFPAFQSFDRANPTYC